MKNVKSITLSLMACVALLLTGCDKKESGSFLDSIVGNPDIESVKNGTLPQYSESLTVGKAFDNWKGCSNPTWEAETTERGEKFVRFSCDANLENIKPACVIHDRLTPKEAEPYCNADKNAIQHLKQVKLAFAFSLNTDGTSFTPVNSTVTSIFDDGKKDISESFLEIALKNVFENEPERVLISSRDYEDRK